MRLLVESARPAGSLSPLPLAGGPIASNDAMGAGNSLHSISATRGGTHTPTFPRKRAKTILRVAIHLSHRALVARLRLACVGDHLLELRHGQNAGNAEFADDEGRRAAEFEGQRLIVVAREDD